MFPTRKIFEQLNQMTVMFVAAGVVTVRTSTVLAGGLVQLKAIPNLHVFSAKLTKTYRFFEAFSNAHLYQMLDRSQTTHLFFQLFSGRGDRNGPKCKVLRWNCPEIASSGNPTSGHSIYEIYSQFLIDIWSHWVFDMLAQVFSRSTFRMWHCSWRFIWHFLVFFPCCGPRISAYLSWRVQMDVCKCPRIFSAWYFIWHFVVKFPCWFLFVRFCCLVV